MGNSLDVQRSTEIFRPYYKAIRSVLNGTSVKDLDELRKRCNREWQELSGETGGYTLGDVVGYTADAENRILMGEDPDNFYDFDTAKSFGITSGETRQQLRELTNNALSEDGF